MATLIIVIAILVLLFCSNTIGKFVLGGNSDFSFILGFFILVALVVIGALLGIYVSKKIKSKGKDISKIRKTMSIITGISGVVALITFIKVLSSSHYTGTSVVYDAFRHKYVTVNSGFVEGAAGLLGNINMFLVFVLLGFLIGISISNDILQNK